MRNFRLSTYFSGRLSKLSIDLETGGSENVLKTTSTKFLSSPQLWTFADYLRTDPSELTICDEQGGSVETLNINDNDVDLSQYANATCGFILYEEDSTANCRDLAPHCEDNRGLAVSKFPCWRLKWCPGTVQHKSQLRTFPICCFHPTSRGGNMDVWKCLKKYYVTKN